MLTVPRPCLATLALVLCAQSCTYEVVTAECDTDSPCPQGQTCVGTRCVADAELDFSVDPGDMAPPDLGLSDLGTSPDLSSAPDLAPACGGMSYRYATNRVLLPTSMAHYAIDIDGDGRTDNQLRSILSAIGAVGGFDLQGTLDRETAAGRLVGLLTVETADLRDFACVPVRVNTAEPHGPADPLPRYDGTDRFRIPLGQLPALLRGALAMSALTTTLPPMLPADDVQRVDLSLPLFPGVMTPLPIYGVHLQGQLGANGIISGELHGVVRKQDIDLIIIPALAQALTRIINMDPNGSLTNTLIQLFEDPVGNPVSKAKCMVPAECCQEIRNRPTCKILPEEVRGNALIDNLLAPDVQVFEGMKWKPVPRGLMKDAMSIGLGFTAVRASF